MKLKMSGNILFWVAVIQSVFANVNCQTKAPEPPQKPYLDISKLVDKYLEYGDQISTTHLKRALAVSTNVFYSTDLLLNDIMKLRPVVQALNENKPDGSSLSVILSLRYVTNNKINEARLKDVFYDLSLNIAKESWKDVFGSVTEILLDFSNLACHSSLSLKEQNKLKSLLSHSYPNFIRNFNRMYCGESDFCHIPTGVIYGYHEFTCANNLTHQMESAEQVMIHLDFETLKHFPLSNASFLNILSNVESKHQQISSKIPQLFINLNEKSAVETVSANWQYKTKSTVQSSKYYTDVVQELISNTYVNGLDLLLQYSEMFSSPYSVKVVLGDALVDRLVHKKAGEETDDEQLRAIPSVYTNEVSKTACQLAVAVNKTGGGNLILDHYTWRALARYKSKIENVSTACSDGTSIGNLVHNNVHLIFESGIKSTWSVLESTMDKLLSDYKKIGNTTLKTIIFHEIDLFTEEEIRNYGYERTKKTNLPIVNFLEKNTSNYLIGCVVNITDVMLKDRSLEQYGNIYNSGGLGLGGGGLDASESSKPNSQIQNLFRKLCEPIFDKVKIMIWTFSTDYSLHTAYSGKHAMIAALRNLFLKEYPSKQVFVNFGNSLDKTDAENLAGFYNMPVIFKSG